MDTTTILTALGSVIAVIGTNVALISWLRSDIRHFKRDIKQWKNDSLKETKEKTEFKKDLDIILTRAAEVYNRTLSKDEIAFMRALSYKNYTDGKMYNIEIVLTRCGEYLDE